jgi:hypothetical protein
MNPIPRMKMALVSVAWAIAVPSSLAGPLSLVSGSEQMTAVSSKVFNGYVRQRLPDGSYRPETYALGNGGVAGGERAGAIPDAGSNMADDTIDNMTFDRMAKTVAVPLAGQNYVPTPNPGGTALLIMVYWGTTFGSARVLDGGLKDYIDAKNAALLGFDSERAVLAQRDPGAAFFGHTFAAGLMRNLHSDVIDALEVNRYYVVLRAFDFQTAWKQKKIKLLWETRFSLSQRQHDFEKEVPGMAQYASAYFGQDSHGLLRSPVPEGRVDIGDVKSLGPVPDK